MNSEKIDKLLELLREKLEASYNLKYVSGGMVDTNNFYLDFQGSPISSKEFESIENEVKKEYDAYFKLLNVSMAHKDGDQSNEQLVRITGIIFDTDTELNKYLEEAKDLSDSDHRVLGEQLGLFFFSKLVGKGLPIYTEKGTTLRRILERFVIDTEIKFGYKHVTTPDLAKVELYEKSGHYPYYKDDMYAPIKIDEEEFILRPMSCPHHFQIYLQKPRSYKDLPMRIAELASLYRYERSGVLTGLTRVRTFTLSDAHIICANDGQAQQEINKALDLIDYMAKVFGLEYGTDYRYRLSLGSEEKSDKYFDSPTEWKHAEDNLRQVLKSRNISFEEVSNDAAFYGPKIDIQMTAINGKEDTAFTVQYDFVMPKRFELKYVDSDGAQKEAVVVHRSSVGSIERFYAFIIEKYKGLFPFWLAPVQLKLISVSESAIDEINAIYNELLEKGIRVEKNINNEPLGKKIASVRQEHIPYWMVIGEKDINNGEYSYEDINGKKNTVSRNELVQHFVDLNDRK